MARVSSKVGAAFSWNNLFKKEGGDKVMDLKKILALPLDILDLEGYLSVHSLLTKNYKAESNIVVQDSLMDLVDNDNASELLLTDSDKIEDQELEGVFDILPAPLHLQEKVHETSAPASLPQNIHSVHMDPPQQPSESIGASSLLVMAVLIALSLFENFRKQTNASQKDIKTKQLAEHEKTQNEELYRRLERETRQHMVDQNTFLKNALEEQKDAMHRIGRDMKTRDEHLANYEESQGSTIQELSYQIRVFQKELQERDEAQHRASVAKEQQDAVVAAQLKDLTSRLKSREEELRVVTAIHEDSQKALAGQLKHLQQQIAASEKVQESQLVHKETQLGDLTAKLKALESKLDTRNSQITCLEHTIEARDEVQQHKTTFLEDQCRDLVLQVRSLTEQHRLHSESLQNDIEKNISTYHTSLQTDIQSVHKACLGALERRCSDVDAGVQELGKKLLETASKDDLIKVQEMAQMEWSAKAQELQEQIQHSTDEPIDRIGSVAFDVQHQKDQLEQLQREYQSREHEHASRLKALTSELSVQSNLYRVQGDLYKEEKCAQDDKLMAMEARLEGLVGELADQAAFELLYRKVAGNLATKIQILEKGLEAQKCTQQQLEAVEDRNLSAIAKMQQESDELVRRVDAECSSVRKETSSELHEIKSQVEAQCLYQQQLSEVIEGEKASSSAKDQVTIGKLSSCIDKLGNLQEGYDSVKADVSVLRSEAQRRDAIIEKYDKRFDDLCSTVQALSSDHSQLSKQVGTEQNDSENRLMAKLEALKRKLEDHEELCSNDSESKTRRYSDLVLVVEGLENQVTIHNDKFVQVEKNVVRLVDEEGKISLNSLNERLVTQEAILQRVAEDVDTYRTVLELVKADNVISRKEIESLTETEKQEHNEQASDCDTRRSAKEILIRVEHYLDHKSLDTPSHSDGSTGSIGHGQPETIVTDASHAIPEEVPCQDDPKLADSVLEVYGEVGKLRQLVSEKEKEFVCLATRLVAFKSELKRRLECVSSFTVTSQGKDDILASRMDFLRNEIELQREQLMKWERTTQKNQCYLNEKQEQYGLLVAKAEHARHELEYRMKQIADLSATGSEEGMSGALKVGLEDKLHFHKQQCVEWKAKVLGIDGLLNECEKECSSTSARLSLFLEDSQRRKDKIRGLENSFDEVSELAKAQRADHDGELRSLQETRDLWKLKTDKMSALLRQTEGEYLDLQEQLQKRVGWVGQNTGRIIAGGTTSTRELNKQPNGAQLVEKLSGEIHVAMPSLGMDNQSTYENTLFAKIGSLKCQLEARQETEERQEKTFAKTKEALESQLEESKKQCQELAESMASRLDDTSSREYLSEKIKSIREELLSRQVQLSCLEEEQVTLKKDFDSQIELIKSEIGAQEELQGVVQQSYTGTSLSALSLKFESLASRFMDRGDIIAKVGALSDGLRGCEDRLLSYEKEQAVAKDDLHCMIEFFKSDLQVQKLLLEQHLKESAGHDFSSLLEKIKQLSAHSKSQVSQIVDMEKSLKSNEDFCSKLAAEIQEKSFQVSLQSEQILQQLNEKYIELATKVEVLTSELRTRGEQSSGRENRDRDHEALYMTQMDSIKVELEARQVQHQQQIQVRMYDAMVQIASVMARQKASPVPHSSERTLVSHAFKRQSAPPTSITASKNAGRKRSRDRKGVNLAEGSIIGVSQHTLRSRPGYSMASGIMMKNQFVPAMLGTFTTIRGQPKKKDLL